MAGTLEGGSGNSVSYLRTVEITIQINYLQHAALYHHHHLTIGSFDHGGCRSWKPDRSFEWNVSHVHPHVGLYEDATRRSGYVV